MHFTTPGSLGPLRQLQIAPLDFTTPEIVPRASGAAAVAVYPACRATPSEVPDENQRVSPPTRASKRKRTAAPSREVTHSPAEIEHDSGLSLRVKQSHAKRQVSEQQQQQQLKDTVHARQQQLAQLQQQLQQAEQAADRAKELADAQLTATQQQLHSSKAALAAEVHKYAALQSQHLVLSQELAALRAAQSAITSQLHEASVLEERLKSEVHALTAQLAAASAAAENSAAQLAGLAEAAAAGASAVKELKAIEVRSRRLRTLTGSIPADSIKQTLAGELCKQTEQHESSLKSVQQAHDRTLALQATVHQRKLIECDVAIAAVNAELEQVTVTAALAARKARGRLGVKHRQATEATATAARLQLQYSKARHQLEERNKQVKAVERAANRPDAIKPHMLIPLLTPDAVPELPQLVTAQSHRRPRRVGEAVHVRARLTRLHLVGMGIAAEKVDKCIGVVLHGLRVASLDREGSYGHLNASIGDCHTANLVMGAYIACLHSAGVVQLHWDGTSHRGQHLSGLVMRFLKQNGETQRWVLGVRWVLDGKGETTLHTLKEVYGEYIEAVNLLESEGLVSAEQAEVGRRAYCLEAIAVVTTDHAANEESGRCHIGKEIFANQLADRMLRASSSPTAALRPLPRLQLSASCTSWTTRSKLQR